MKQRDSLWKFFMCVYLLTIGVLLIFSTGSVTGELTRMEERIYQDASRKSQRITFQAKHNNFLDNANPNAFQRDFTEYTRLIAQFKNQFLIPGNAPSMAADSLLGAGGIFFLLTAFGVLRQSRWIKTAVSLGCAASLFALIYFGWELNLLYAREFELKDLAVRLTGYYLTDDPGSVFLAGYGMVLKSLNIRLLIQILFTSVFPPILIHTYYQGRGPSRAGQP